MSVGIEAFQFVEFFAGSRMATQCVAGAGYRATCIDIDDHAKAGYAIGEGTVFDILSPSGLVFPYCSMIDWTLAPHVHGQLNNYMQLPFRSDCLS
jgi:hypothetical protein